MKHPHHMTALEAAAAIEAGTLTCQALVRSCLDRIELRNADVLAFTAINPELALSHARAADRTTPFRSDHPSALSKLGLEDEIHGVAAAARSPAQSKPSSTSRMIS